MSSHQPLLENDIEPDEDAAPRAEGQMATNQSDAESGEHASVSQTHRNFIFSQASRPYSGKSVRTRRVYDFWSEPTNQSAHPVALLFLFLFRTLAIVIYLLGGFLFPGNYVLSTVVVVVLLAMDFWTCKVTTLPPSSMAWD
jgi:hypothetical protein